MPCSAPACFRGGAAAAAAAAALATSVYETRVGLVALSWSRSCLGLSLRVDLLLTPSDDDDDDDDEETLGFRIRPWSLWKRRGSKRFPMKRHAGIRRRRFVDLAWDLTRARFSGAASPEPAAGYFVSVAVDGEVVLVAGEAAVADPSHTLISRREHAVIGGPGASRTYRTTARLGGREREREIEIAIELGAEKAKEKEKERGRRGLEEVGMLIMVDGNCALNVPRLRWAFRGSETVSTAPEGGGRIRVSWDLHNWLFRRPDDSPPAPTVFGDTGDAVFVFRFEQGGDGDTNDNCSEGDGYFQKKGGDFAEGGYFGKRSRKNWSESRGSNTSSSNSRGRRKKSLLKPSSLSSSSSASSTASTSTVAMWASPEEAEMQRGDAFSLLVYAWRR